MGVEKLRQGFLKKYFGAASQRKAIGLKTSAKFVYTSLLLCLAVILTGFTATGTIQAYQHFQQDHQRIQAGDVTTVRSWMTIPYVARVYKVPEPCFTQTLHLNDRWLVEHATLRTLADHYKRSLTGLIINVQHVIVMYRRKQLSCGPPPPPPALLTTRSTSTRPSPTPAWKGKTP
jgi:hypothetical protein